MAGRFAFMVHPLETSDIARKFKAFKYLPGGVVDCLIRSFPPLVASRVEGLESAHNRAGGWFVACPLTSKQMMTLPEPWVLRKIIRTGRLAQRLGARILGLGAFTSVVGDAGVTVARNLDLAVTTGNTYTVATALEATFRGAEYMGHDPHRAEFVVIGATGSIGQACSLVLARQVRHLTIVGRDAVRLEHLARRILKETGLVVDTSVDLKGSVPRADVVVSVSSSVDALIEPEDLKPGSVVCDVARPRDVSARVSAERDDVLVLEGGVVEAPGSHLELNLDIGLPPRMVMACMAETMILALEQRYENFTLGRNLTVERIDEMNRLAAKHGFRVARFRSYERAYDDGELEAIRKRAAARRAGSPAVVEHPAGPAAGGGR